MKINSENIWSYLTKTNLGFTFPVKHFPDEHSTNRESHLIVCITNTIAPLLLPPFCANKNLPQDLVSIAKRPRKKRRHGPHGLPNQIVIQYSAERKGREGWQYKKRHISSRSSFLY